MKILLALEGPVEEGPNIWADTLYNYLTKRFNNEKDTIEQVRTNNLKSLIQGIFSIKKYDIFHFYSQSYGAALLFLLFKIFRKKTIYTLHGNIKIESKYKPKPINWLWVPAHLFVLKYADRVTYPSDYLKRAVQFYFKSKKMLKKSKFAHNVIHNGIMVGEYPINLNQDKSQRLKKIREGKIPLRILTLTSFYFEPKTKGVELLIETNKIIINNGIKTVIRIGGKGPQLDEYKEKYQSEKINFLGYCDIDKENKWADIFIHLSFLDNLPLVILQAGSIGLPTIASECGGIPEIFSVTNNKTVWGLTPNSVDVVASKLMELISNEKFYLEVSKEQYINIKENFNISKICNEFWTLYKNLK